MESTNPILSCKVNEESLVAIEAEQFSITVSLIDSKSFQVVPDIAWAVKKNFNFNK